MSDHFQVALSLPHVIRERPTLAPFGRPLLGFMQMCNELKIPAANTIPPRIICLSVCAMQVSPPLDHTIARG